MNQDYNYESIMKVVDEAAHRDNYYTDSSDVDASILHQISDLTKWIRTKQKGSDVREIIAQLFERTWLEGMKEGNANLEVAEARSSFNNLGSRISSLEGILSGKADDAQIKSMLKNIMDGSPRGTFDNIQELRARYPQGTQGVFITTNNKNWNYWNGNDWQAGGVYQAAQEVLSKQVSDGKSSAYIHADYLKIDFDSMQISVRGGVIVDGANNLWTKDYTGTLSKTNGFLVYNKSLKIYDLSAIENFDKDNVIIGIFWNGGRYLVNSVREFSVIMNGVNKVVNKREGLNFATVIGWKDISINNMKFTGEVTLFDNNNTSIRGINNLDIRAVNDATSGYIIYNSTRKEFTLEVLETNLSTKGSDDYLITIMWANGYYIENGALKRPKETLPNKKPANNMKIITLGDSITQGLKNYNTPRELYDKAWPDYMLEFYGGSLNNVAISGKSIVGTGPEDFNGQVNSNNFASYDIAIIAFGTNDTNIQADIENVKRNLRKGLDKIFADNKNISVAGILPHNLFRLPYTTPPNTVYADALKFQNRNGQTLNDYCNAIAGVYDEYEIPYIDWRKAPVLTMRNHKKWCWDAIHPNEAGHKLIGRRVAEWLKVNV